VALGRVLPEQKDISLRTRTLQRVAATAAVATVGVVGLAGVAGASTPRPYTVKAGDTLSRLAPDNWRQVAAGNHIADPDLIFVGQIINLNLTAPAHETWSHRSTTSHQRTVTTTRHHVSHSAAASSSASGSTVWDRLAQCESGGNWAISTGNGYYGGLQFTQGSWNAAGGSGNPANASRAEQIRVAENLKSSQGWGAWPSCSRQLGLR
jgi:LysM repeat protein